MHPTSGATELSPALRNTVLKMARQISSKPYIRNTHHVGSVHQTNPEGFDFHGDGDVDVVDVQALFGDVIRA